MSMSEAKGVGSNKAAWLAWSIFAAVLGLSLVANLLMIFLVHEPMAFLTEEMRSFIDPLDRHKLSMAVGHLLFALVGVLVASRRPSNPIGWIFCGVGVAYAALVVTEAYASYALFFRPGTLPLGSLVGWTVVLWGPVGMILVALGLLLFPNGRLPSPGWRSVAWIPSLILVPPLLRALHPEREFWVRAGIEKLLVLEGLRGQTELIEALWVATISLAALPVAASLVVRLRRATGIERQQLKWFAYSALMLVMAAVVIVMFDLSEAAWLGFLLMAALPISVGIAILRHRLYDIDLLIRRTLVYGALTASLGLLYWGGVLLLQLVLRPVTEGSELAIIGSVLAVAALFRPARRRIQEAVDRRFYRQKYDAQRTLEAFSAKLREQTDLDSLGRELVGVVRQTVQPAKVSLWLRTPERKT